MTRYVALLRGVNVGGVRISMADLRAAVSSCGHTEVATYVQSGNVVLTATREPEPVAMAAEIRSAIAERSGIDPLVIVLRAREWDDLAAANPYPQEPDGTKLHAVIAAEDFTPEQRAAADRALAEAREAGSRDELTVLGRVTYLHLPDGMGRSKLADLLMRRKPTGHHQATARNWRTVLALQGMLGS